MRVSWKEEEQKNLPEGWKISYLVELNGLTRKVMTKGWKMWLTRQEEKSPPVSVFSSSSLNSSLILIISGGASASSPYPPWWGAGSWR